MDVPNLNISYWVLQTVAMMVTALLIPKLKVTGPFGALVTVVALAFFNATVWDAALFFHVPDRITVQALFLLSTNGVIFWILIKLLPGIEVEGLAPALIAPLVFTVCSLIIAEYSQYIDWVAVLDFVIELLKTLRDHFHEHVSAASETATPAAPAAAPTPTP